MSTPNTAENTMSAAPDSSSQENHVQKAKQVVSNLTESTSRAFGSFVNSSAIQQFTTRKYTMPDKTVASQVLMYRQLLHTKAKPGLKLSRQYQGTPAQQAVKHMPWWEQGIDETQKMIISYDNLIVRLWLHGAILPFTGDMLGHNSAAADSGTTGSSSGGGMDTLIDDKGLPPVPHKYWTERLGFQQEDPVTDFRSGGVLSLAMMVYMVESCPAIVQRFRNGGDASVLPFGITCINITDMMAKFLMLSKSVDKMDALLSQKPFWKMFGDPNAILALQELSMEMLCDVVVDLGRERKIPGHNTENENRHGELDGNVTVFDFPLILETTERRIRDDLLGAGPKTVDELRHVAARLKVRYESELADKERRSQEPPSQPLHHVAGQVAGQVVGNANSVAAGVFSKIKAASPNLKEFAQRQTGGNANEPKGGSTTAAAAPSTSAASAIPDLLTANSSPDKQESENPPTSSEEGVWVNHSDADDLAGSVGHFSIGDDDDDDDV